MTTISAAIRRLLLSLLLLATPAAALAQDLTQDLALEDIEFVEVDSGRVLMTLTLSGPAPQPSVFTVDQPARLSLDLPGTRTAVAQRYQRINLGNVRAVASAESRGRTRVVVELGSSAPYAVDVDGNRILVRLDSLASARVAQSPIALRDRGASLQGVDFRRGEKGEGRVLVRLSDPNTVVDVKPEGGKIVARFRNTRLAENAGKRLDVLDFATPVRYVDIRADGNDSLVSLTPVSGQDYEQAAYQSGDVFTIELQPLSLAEKEELQRTRPQFTGERISLSFQNVEVRSLLQIIADVAGTNMVISDSVEGEMAMRLESVPWDQALDIILRTKGLGMRQQGNVMLVAPLGEIAEREQLELEAAKQKTELAPLRSELIQVNYAKASDMRALLSSGDTSLLSERGRVTVDERTNTLLVLETREKIDEIRELLAQLDIPVRQVLIESRIVIANDDFARELGTRFGASTISRSGSTTIGQSGGAPIAGGTTTGGGGGGTTGGTGGGASGAGNSGSRTIIGGGIPSATDNYIVNLPVANAAGAIGWTILGSNFLIDLELSALQQEGRGEIISTPRVVTANGKQAVIEQGREIPYQSSSGNAGTETQFKKAVLSLTVSPQITPDDRVIMDLSVTNDSQGEDVNTGVGSAPAIDTRRLDTQVLIASGETVVLGGVFQEETRRSSAKVPYLGDIPLLGTLFRRNSRSDNKRELLIFVTPRVLQEGLIVK